MAVSVFVEGQLKDGEKDGFTVNECETTATYEWENLNKVSGLQFTDIACADEMNTEIALYIETFVDGIVGDILPIYTGFFTDEYEQIKFSVLNLEDKKPEDYISYVQDRPGHDFRYAIDSSKIRKELGWKSKISLKKGLEKTIKYYA